MIEAIAAKLAAWLRKPLTIEHALYIVALLLVLLY